MYCLKPKETGFKKCAKLGWVIFSGSLVTCKDICTNPVFFFCHNVLQPLLWCQLAQWSLIRKILAEHKNSWATLYVHKYNDSHQFQITKIHDVIIISMAKLMIQVLWHASRLHTYYEWKNPYIRGFKNTIMDPILF